MKKNEMVICGKKCILYLNEDTEYILIQPVDENDISVLDNEVKHIEENTDRNFSLVAFKIEDWNSELTPWEMPLLRGKGNFGDGATRTLEFIKNDLIPAVSEYINIEKLKNQREILDLLKKNKYISLLDIELVTGRKHHIRAQLADKGLFIVGDRKYGIRDGSNRFFLCCYFLSFDNYKFSIFDKAFF